MTLIFFTVLKEISKIKHSEIERFSECLTFSVPLREFI